MSYSDPSHYVTKAKKKKKSVFHSAAKSGSAEVLVLLSSLLRDLVRNKMCTMKTLNDYLPSHREIREWLGRIVNELLLAIFSWETGASAYLPVCPTVFKCGMDFILTVPNSGSRGADRRDYVVEEIHY